MQDLKIINYAAMSGETACWDDLPEEKRRQIAETIQDTLMYAAGYQRAAAGRHGGGTQWRTED